MAVNEVARVYASSLIEVGQENKVLEQIDEEVKFINEIFSDDRELRLFINSPGFAKESKKEFLDKIFSGKLSDYTLNFLKLLIENDRQSEINEIYIALSGLIDEINNRKKVTLITRESLDKNTLKKIQDNLKDKLKKDIIIIEEIDESILGGIIIKIDDLVIDGSLAKDLKNIRNDLLNSKVRSDVAYED